MDIITSVTAEISLWELFATSRGANATVSFSYSYCGVDSS